jgi:hypothetical protein
MMLLGIYSIIVLVVVSRIEGIIVFVCFIMSVRVVNVFYRVLEGKSVTVSQYTSTNTYCRLGL